MKKYLYVISALAFLCASAPLAYAGFGITPPYVRTDRLTQGSEYRQEIVLVRGEPVEDLKAEISFNVPEIESWFSIDKGNEFILPKGENQVKMNVIVNVPEDAPYENFTGNIRIRTSSLDTSISGVSIALGAQIDVDITVVDEILDFEVRRIQMGEAEQGHSLWWLDFPGRILFTMDIENTGNAPVAPSRVVFDIYDSKGIKIQETTSNSNDIEKVPAFETKTVEAHVPTYLPPGGYLVKYSIFNGEESKRSGELTLSILPRGTISDYQAYGFAGLSFADKASLFTPLGGLALGGLLSSVRGKPRSKRNNARTPSREPSEEDKPSRPERRVVERRSTSTTTSRKSTVVDLKSRNK